MRPFATRSNRRSRRRVFFVLVPTCLILALSASLMAQVGLDLKPQIPGDFDPEADLRAPIPFRLYASDSLAAFAQEGMLFRVETEYDTTNGIYTARRLLFGQPYGPPKVYTEEAYLEYKIERARRESLREKFFSEISRPSRSTDGGALEIQVPFKIKSRTFRRIFGGDRVGLKVTGNLTIDGGLRREKSDQVITTQNDQANTNFKIDQTQQFHITGKVGDKVSVEIDQDSEALFDFENNVKLTYTGEEDEIIQSIEAGNVNLSLPGTQLATLSTHNKGLFGFKTVSRIGPLSITTITSLQKGEKNRKSLKGGSETQTYVREDRDFIRNQYFFVDEYFRENYSNFTSDFYRRSTGVTIEEIQVFKNYIPISGDNQPYYDCVALYYGAEEYGDLTDPDQIGQIVRDLKADPELQSDRNAASELFKLLVPDQDYTYDRNLGYIRLNYPAQNEDIIAVAYRLSDPLEPNGPTVWGTLGSTGDSWILKLIKPKAANPSDSTWNLSWKHVYWMGTTGLRPEDFNLKIVRNVAGGLETNTAGRSWLEVFGLDQRGQDGSSAPDGKIDDIFVNYQHGEIAFPDLRPFDPEGYVVGSEIKDYSDELVADTTSLLNPDIYDIPPNSGTPINSLFQLEASYSNVSSTFNLGFNILEDSEEVLLNGRKLKRGSDYTIDYLSGTLTILNQAAFDPGADLEISYESGEIFQLDKRTMIGVRLEYSLWEDSFVGGTFLYFNEKPIDRRVKVGNEPLRNVIWDFNARLRFRPYFMTSLINALPLIDTDVPSEVTFEGEIAQVFPNPNSLNSPSTGDDDGVAYIDDFEAAKRATPLSVMRAGWFPASKPVDLETELGFSDRDVRGRLFWYNPYRQVPIKEIWPNREVNSKVANSVHVLTMEFDPTVNNFRREGEGYEPESTWNGIMRALSAGYYIQTNTKFIEIWMKWNSRGENAALYVDMGEISEDVIPNGVLDTEDKPIGGGVVGNLVLDEGEDTGIDGRDGPDPPWDKIVDDTDYNAYGYDWWELDVPGDPGYGVHDPDEPYSTDDWAYSQGNYDRVNGTENNEQDEKGRYPDSEDLDRNNQLTTANHFFRYRFRLRSAEDSLKYIVGGQDNENNWRLIRIPIEDVYREIGNADLTQIKFMRIWLGGFTGKSTIQIAQFELVGNEWLEDPVVDPVTQDTTIYLTTTTINTHDNPEDYIPPPGVAGEIDPITDIRSKEQSLVVKVLDGLPTAAEGQVIKTLYQSQDLREYRQLKMFVNGGGRHPESLEGKNLTMFLRFGTGFYGNQTAYYEYAQRLQPGWTGNEIVIDVDRLNRLKRLAETSGTNTAQEVLPNGDVVKVVGSPSLGKIDKYAVGLRNFGAPVLPGEELEIWVDELRLSGIRKENGMAMRSSFTAKFADLLDLGLDMNQRDADFHQVDKRIGSDRTQLNAQVNASIKLDKVLDPKLGVSIPLSGTAKNSLSIPKYTTNNGDVRTESVVDDGTLNIWNRFGKFMLKKDHLEDKLLLNPDGTPVIDPVSGIPRQDPEAWGIDTLFQTEQQYTWSTSFSKNKPSSNFLIKYTLDKLSAQANHSQSYNSNLNYQYQKTFTNRGKLSYNLPFERADLKIFSWTEHIPILKKLADSRFNYWPTRITASLDGTETTKSDKYRNAKVRPSYNLNLTRSFSTGLQPLQSINVDYSYSANSKYARADSTRQIIIYSDQPDVDPNNPDLFTLKSAFFAPNTPDAVILDSTLARLAVDSSAWSEAALVYNEIEQARESGTPDAWIIETIFAELDNYSWADMYKRPWENIGPDDPRYKEKFWTIGNMPFVDVQKTQRISANYNPSLFKWLNTGFNYSSNYTWTWQNFSYSGRTVSTSSNLGANITLKLRQLLPAERGGGRDRGSRGRQGNIPDAGGFGRGPRGNDTQNRAPEDEGEEENPEEGPKRPQLPKINPLKLLLQFGRMIQDPRFDYTQSLGFTNPTVQEGSASLRYQLGLTGNPGLGQVPGYTAVQTNQRSDDYRLRSGIDWSTRISTGLDYNIRFQRSIGQQESGSETRSAFFRFKDDKVNVSLLDIPNWSLRWSGIEQYGPLSKIAQSISLDHTYNGSYSEDYTVRIGDDGLPFQEIGTRRFEKNFSPLIGLNITWLYQVSTSIRFNESIRVTDSPKNGSKARDRNQTINFNVSYTRKSGFRIPIPIWPFKNARFDNQTTFSLSFDKTQSLSETQRGDSGFEMTQEQSSWSVMPKIDYSFSRTVTGGMRYKYGVNKSATFTTSYYEFGINLNISIRG